MSNLAIIGIRSGSRGVINKNIKLFCGKPLIYWIIQSALKSIKLDKIIVSTDSEEYRDIVLDYGVEAPFLRPKQLSQDNSLEKEYLLHGLEWLYKNEGYKMSDFPQANANYEHEISLPVYYDLTNEQIKRVVDVIKKAVESILC